MVRWWVCALGQTVLRTEAENELSWQRASLGRNLTSGGTPGKVRSSVPQYLSEHLRQKGGVSGESEGLVMGN